MIIVVIFEIKENFSRIYELYELEIPWIVVVADLLSKLSWLALELPC